MSEYQYYEFRAIDRPLTDQQARVAGHLDASGDLPHVVQ